ncbi:MAG: histidine phosphatase family protein [Leptothrix sp. (in: b-proteobacteria)]
MGTTYLIRHGQASLGAADYDQLSTLGHQQAERLGAHWRERGLAFDAVLCGTLRRQRQTLAGIERGLGQPLPALDWPGLNEYDSDALLAALDRDEPAPEPIDVRTPDGHRAHFRRLRTALQRWAAGTLAAPGLRTHADWVAGVLGALAHVQSQHPRGAVLVVSSGGPIATALGHALCVPVEGVIELNLRLRNTSVSELARSPRGHRVHSVNGIAHLDDPAHAGWITYA